tara:strand:- start:16759 stop:16986 length:228 start_codon:yes stop_codon:yes gene_type:complete
MPNIQIDGKDYDVDELSDEAKAQVASINFVDRELARLNALAAAMQTARNGYGMALNEILGVNTDAEVVTDNEDDD